MDIKSILANAATMLFLAGCSGEQVLTNYTPTINNVLQVCVPTEGQTLDLSKSPTFGLREVINWQLNNTSYDKDLFLQQVKLKLGNDETTFNAIKLGLNTNLTDELKVVTKIRLLKSSIDNDLNKFEFDKSLDVLRFKIKAAQVGSAEEAALYDELALKLEKVRSRGLSAAKKNLVRSIDLTNIQDVSENFDAANEVYNNDGILTFGLQGWCDLFGENQGIRRGETLVISALQHKWKSGAILTSAVQACVFNYPTYLRLPKPEEGKEDHRKAMILHITLENDALGELLSVYKYIKEQETGLDVPIINLTKEERVEASKYVSDYFNARGFSFRIEQFAAGDFDYSQLFATIEGYEELGYEVHLVTLDYMGKMSTRGCIEGPHGKNIQDLYQRIQNYMLRKKIAFITAHQMSTEAKALERNGEEILVKAVCELGYYAGCRTVDNEVDIEIYQHKIIIGGKHYITWQRGKHRKPGNPTPEEMKFCVYQMFWIGAIPWDKNKEPTYTRRVPGYGNTDVNVDMF